MLGRTHLSLGVILLFILARFTDLIRGNEALTAVLILLASLLPDIDTATSTFGRKLKFLRWFTKHRGFFHSIIAMVFFTVIVQVLFDNRSLSLVFMAGYGLHLLTDSVTKDGTRLFYPAEVKTRGPLRVGSFAETLIFLALVILSVYLLI